MIQSKEEYIENTFSKINISITKRQECQFLKYYELLTEWNEKINLTAITEFEDVCNKHFADSSLFFRLFDSFDESVISLSGKRLVDVGTGAGFPGIVLKILYPDLSIVLLDSLDKRIRFLNEVISTLELSDIVAVHGRVEDLARMSEYREVFDFSTARAVAALPVLSEYCLPFVKMGGSFIAYKSEKTDEEVSSSKKAFDILGGKLERLVSFELPDSASFRTLVEVKKVKSTPSSYPRKAGTPVKKPL